MKKMKQPNRRIMWSVVLSGILFTAACVSQSSASATIDWYGYEKGFSTGKAKGKKILIYFRSSQCTYCKKMEEETFSDADVAGYMSKHFTPVKVDLNNDRKVAVEYRISAVPNIIFMSEEGEPISGLPGYVPADDMMHILKYLHTDSYETMSFEDFIDGKKQTGKQ